MPARACASSFFQATDQLLSGEEKLLLLLRGADAELDLAWGARGVGTCPGGEQGQEVGPGVGMQV